MATFWSLMKTGPLFSRHSTGKVNDPNNSKTKPLQEARLHKPEQNWSKLVQLQKI